MAKTLFSSATLVAAWAKAANSNPKGTRRDVVVDIMKQIELDPNDDEAYRRMYNNVTQRVKLLTKRNAEVSGPLVFAELATGPRGSRVNLSEIEQLAAVMMQEQAVDGNGGKADAKPEKVEA